MFTRGFLKTANSEQAEYEEANAVDSQLQKLPAPSSKGLKAGERVAYYSDDRGWKRGPWASHQKGCSQDEGIRKDEEAWLKTALKEAGLPANFKAISGKGSEAKQAAWREINRQAGDKFPRHHSNDDWKTKAIRIGDLGTVHKVQKFQTRAPVYDIIWDKHPECVWGGYDTKDLKTAPKGM